jgi:N6-L-threonylcarbamoyladenine synthase
VSLARTLGIETSCDETAVAVLAGDGSVEVNLLASQAQLHAAFGGVVPELASREHLAALPWLVERALAEARAPLELVGVTAGPGLIGALLVGVRFAAAFAWARRMPMVAVDHLDGHLVSPLLDLGGAPARPIPDPTLALVASGGHSSWYLLAADGTSSRLNRTRDDAAGEAFDKLAQALGLAYPGGPVVDRLARAGDPGRFALPHPRIRDDSLDFSFSGLKSAAIRWVREAGLRGAPDGETPQEVRDLLAGFEETVVELLLAPLATLVARHRPVLLAASGGVAANTLLRRRLLERGAELGLEVRLPPPALTTDNAAMIARAGQLAFARGSRDDPRRLDAHSRQSWQPPGTRRDRATVQ